MHGQKTGKAICIDPGTCQQTQRDSRFLCCGGDDLTPLNLQAASPSRPCMASNNPGGRTDCCWIDCDHAAPSGKGPCLATVALANNGETAGGASLHERR